MFKFFKRKIKLESFEVRIIINSLKAMRNKLIENNEDTEYVDEILLKYLYDLLKKDMPSISKLLDKLILENSNSSLDNFLNWFDNESNYIKIANLANVDAYQYINKIVLWILRNIKTISKVKISKEWNRWCKWWKNRKQLVI